MEKKEYAKKHLLFHMKNSGRKAEYWLAKLSLLYGYSIDLYDGPHSTPEKAAEALPLIRSVRKAYKLPYNEEERWAIVETRVIKELK